MSYELNGMMSESQMSLDDAAMKANFDRVMVDADEIIGEWASILDAAPMVGGRALHMSFDGSVPDNMPSVPVFCTDPIRLNLPA